MSNIKDNIEHIKQNIKATAEQADRDPSTIKLLAISKTHPPETVIEAYEAGLTCFGENRIQEAEQKINALSNLNLEWHLVGPLQSNKVKKAFSLFDFIHSVDRIKIINALEKEAEKLQKNIKILLQVNVGEEPQKSGASLDEVDDLVDQLTKCHWVQCKGFMTVPPFLDDPESIRPYFRKLNEISNKKKIHLFNGEGRWELSMGMTHDYEIAIQEGATIIRLGTAIFGKRAGY